MFAPGGAIPSALGVGTSPFQVSQAALSPGEQAEAARAAAATQQGERLAWEQARSVELGKLKAKIEAQRLKHGSLASQLAAAQEETKKAQAAGGGLEEAAIVARLLVEGGQALTLLDSMEKYRLELESEAFSKVSAKVTRGSPY